VTIAFAVGESASTGDMRRCLSRFSCIVSVSGSGAEGSPVWLGLDRLGSGSPLAWGLSWLRRGYFGSSFLWIPISTFYNEI
jgi:hypothetical protein